MSVIEFEWAGQEWTEADSDALDRETLAYRARKGLEPIALPVTHKELESKICVRCGVAMRTRRSTPTPGTEVHAARGYCRNCYGKAVRNGAFTPITPRPSNELRDQARKLYQEGLEIKVIASALGCTERAVYRYTKDIRDAS